ncbi:MAG: hypothetical protein NC231_02740 [Bacillus sp. (in: Bacteria)]|nr:hypothetical protein [Bacillus sp. (in: firmicutes)]MCM1425332.1 hypothetical protein [Eubacterium sp.]
MILTFINWFYITLTAGIMGIGVLTLLKKTTGYACKEADVCLFTGIAFVTAYAEIFSLFYKVAGLANVFLLLLCILTAVLCRKQMADLLKMLYQKALCIKKEKLSKSSVIHAALVAAAFMVFWFIACQRAYHADTDLYHAQAIRWLEEYGIVKGLGNLHNRFAYNSAFMPLQALYSWAFLIDQSMHVMNAYLCMLVTVYALIKFPCQKGKYKASNCFVPVIILYDMVNMGTMASPGTDHFVLLFLLYLLGKWCDYAEEKETPTEAYGLLCILALYALTVKLSVAMIMILTIKPAVELIKAKKGKTIGVLITAGLFILLPFCIRNFIISGYFVYPMTVSGFLDVDWKMLPYSVEFDKEEIASYAKGVYDELRYHEVWNMSIREWFPVWWQTLALWLKFMMVSHIVWLPAFVVINIIKIIKKRPAYDIVINIAVLAQFLYWLLSAPLGRYGSIVLFLIPCMVVIHLLENRQKTAVMCYQALLPFVLTALMLCLGVQTVRYMEKLPLKRSSYYVYREGYEIEWENMTIYGPIENNYTGYYAFPGTPCVGMLPYIELRGASVEDGFRVKEEYKKLKLTTNGTVMER